MSLAVPHAPLLVVFYGGSPQERREADGLARAAGWRVRLASRPAELAKATADGGARVCVLDPQLTVPTAHLTRTPGETMAQFVSRALTAPEPDVGGSREAGGDQVTSSA